MVGCLKEITFVLLLLEFYVTRGAPPAEESTPERKDELPAVTLVKSVTENVGGVMYKTYDTVNNIEFKSWYTRVTSWFTNDNTGPVDGTPSADVGNNIEPKSWYTSVTSWFTNDETDPVDGTAPPDAPDCDIPPYDTPVTPAPDINTMDPEITDKPKEPSSLNDHENVGISKENVDPNNNVLTHHADNSSQKPEDTLDNLKSDNSVDKPILEEHVRSNINTLKPEDDKGIDGKNNDDNVLPEAESKSPDEHYGTVDTVVQENKSGTKTTNTVDEVPEKVGNSERITGSDNLEAKPNTLGKAAIHINDLEDKGLKENEQDEEVHADHKIESEKPEDTKDKTNSVDTAALPNDHNLHDPSSTQANPGNKVDKVPIAEEDPDNGLGKEIRDDLQGADFFSAEVKRSRKYSRKARMHSDKQHSSIEFVKKTSKTIDDNQHEGKDADVRSTHEPKPSVRERMIKKLQERDSKSIKRRKENYSRSGDIPVPVGTNFHGMRNYSVEDVSVFNSVTDFSESSDLSDTEKVMIDDYLEVKKQLKMNKHHKKMHSMENEIITLRRKLQKIKEKVKRKKYKKRHLLRMEDL